MITQVWHVPCRANIRMSDQGMKMYRKLMWAAAAVLALAPFEAQATTLAFRFETQDAQFTANGALTISDALDSAGGYDVTGIGGTVSGPNGGAITGLVTNPSAPSADDDGSRVYDNVVFPSGPWVDASGLLFAAGEHDYNLYSKRWMYYPSSFDPAQNYNPGDILGRLSVMNIPEPATWLMMGLGFAALGAAGGRSSRRDCRTAFD